MLANGLTNPTRARAGESHQDSTNVFDGENFISFKFKKPISEITF